MKKGIWIALSCFVFPFILIGLCLTGFSGGGIGSAASPLPVFASEEKAEEYQYIGTELGVPWDIMMLADGINAYAAGKSSIEDVNPIYTALEFCILQEEKILPGSSEEVESEETLEVLQTNFYAGKHEIMEYLGELDADLTYENVVSVVNALNEKAREESSDDLLVQVQLLANPDYEDVMQTYIGLDQKNTEWVMALYVSNYLPLMYGYSYVSYDDVVLPEVISGDVSRNELVTIATSILDHPYMMGGKSSKVGTPEGPLDCSGYVDWVFIQCFGSGVSKGTIPDGIAVSGTAQQWYASEEIKKDEIQIGDLGFLRDPASMRSGQVNHVGICIGIKDGVSYWVHCGGSNYGTDDLPTGRVCISKLSGTNYLNPVTGEELQPGVKACKFKYFRRPRFEYRTGGLRR